MELTVTYHVRAQRGQHATLIDQTIIEDIVALTREEMFEQLISDLKDALRQAEIIATGVAWEDDEDA